VNPVTGATGRTGRHVVAAAAARDLTPVALARNGNHAPDPTAAAAPDLDAVIFVHGFVPTSEPIPPNASITAASPTS